MKKKMIFSPHHERNTLGAVINGENVQNSGLFNSVFDTGRECKFIIMTDVSSRVSHVILNMS